MKNTIEFTQAIINNTNASVRESYSKKLKNSKKLSENKKSAKIVEAQILEDEELDIAVDDVKEVEPEVEDTVQIEDGENFEESLTDNVYFCNTCKKHFIATEDTPVEDIVCPICNEADMLIAMGSAEDALDDKENEEVAVEIQDEESEEEVEAPVEDEVVADDEIDFEEDDLAEGFKALAQKHIGENCRVRFKECRLTKDGNFVIEGRLFPNRKSFKVVFEGIGTHLNDKNKKFVLEGTTTMFKGSNKLRALFIREGNTIKVKKCGYGFIKESKNGNKQKIKGILG